MDWVEIALVSIVGVLLAVEAVSLIAGDRPITGAMREDARRWLIWPWGLGLLATHFWSPWASPSWGWIVSGAVGIEVLTMTLLGRRKGVLWPQQAPVASLILGLLCGLLWSSGY